MLKYSRATLRWIATPSVFFCSGLMLLH